MLEIGQNHRVAATRVIQIKLPSCSKPPKPKHPFIDVPRFKLRFVSKCTTAEHMLRLATI